MTLDELLQRTSPLIGSTGGSFYFTPETTEAGRSVGLGAFRFYFLGRGGVIGDVSWPVVHSAFGYFSPALVEKLWTTSRERCPVPEAVVLHLESCREHGRRRFASIAGLDGFCEAAEAVVAAARRDPAALTLFAGLAAQPLPDDAPGRAMQLVATLRELRGSAHLVAVTSVGLPTPVAHRIARPDFLHQFGWEPEQVREPTDDDRARLALAEARTDDLVRPAYATLTEQQRETFLTAVEAMAAATAS